MIGTVIYSTDRETREALRALIGSRRSRQSVSVGIQTEDLSLAMAEDRANAGR